jgi:hypothetical protein
MNPNPPHSYSSLSTILYPSSPVSSRHARTSELQDRVIRLEERLRYTQLLTPADLARTHALTLHQIVALRFASDAELPALLNRTLSENLAPKQIKQSIQSWRPDHTRI